ncbi:hypothetical protein EMPG_10251, partial [Blastomyces silverae]
ETNLISLSERAVTLFSKEYTSIFYQRFKISESTVYYSMSLSVTLLLSQSLHFYIYNNDKKIKIRDFLKYKSKILSEYHSFIQTF